MIDALASSIWWDWFKLARRWMPWILLAILLLLSQLAVWGSYFTFQSLRQTGGTIPIAPGTRGPPASVSCADVLAGDTSRLPANTSPQVVAGLQAQCRQTQARLNQQLRQFYDSFTLPGSIGTALSIGTTVGLILLAILTASHIGGEYSWGTVRPVLARGVGRWQFVVGKLMLLAILAAAALLVVVAATALSSAAAAALTPPPPQTAATSTWSHAAVTFGKSWSAFLPYLAFAGFVTLLTRSSAAGMAIAIGYYLGEQVVVAILGGLFDWFGAVARYLLGQNIAAWAGLSFFGQGQTRIDSTHAFIVLLVYTLGLGGASVLLFQRRDVAGTAG